MHSIRILILRIKNFNYERLTWGNELSLLAVRTFSGFKSQWTIFLSCKYLRASRILAGLQRDSIIKRVILINTPFLCYKKLRNSFVQLSVFGRHDHIQHVSLEFLHHNENLVLVFEHIEQIDNARMMQSLNWDSKKQLSSDLLVLTARIWTSWISLLSLFWKRFLSTCLIATWSGFLLCFAA